ncbi:unnamed protein product [Lactuca virosa]|uniref:Secreted protein n=1 Tax=Lactuca virosa TaxID=75947 RepID=A0AAU9NA56_9ASTR|nr:unnamed protein product [Lactuca virosa]
MKIPPRCMLTTQLVGTLVVGMMNLAGLHPEIPSTSPKFKVTFDAFVIWGVIGPERIFCSQLSPTPLCIWSESAMSSKAAATIYCGGRSPFQRLRLLCIWSESAEKVNGCGEGPVVAEICGCRLSSLPESLHLHWWFSQFRKKKRRRMGK